MTLPDPAALAAIIDRGVALAHQTLPHCDELELRRAIAHRVLHRLRDS
jgi:hypothetical protein